MGAFTARLRRTLGRTRARLSPPALVLMYHRVAVVAQDPWQLAVTPSHFAEHLEVLRRYGRPLALRDLTRMLATGRPPRRGIVLTLDDGYADNLLDARLVLERQEVPATIFVAAGCLGRRNGFWWDELERLVLAPVNLPQQLRLEVRDRIHEHDLGVDSCYPVEAQAKHAGWRARTDAPTGRHRLFLALYRLLRPLRDSERQRVLGDLAAWSAATPSDSAPARPLTVLEVGALASGGLVEIGAHTLTHPQLSALDREDQWAEIRGSREALQEATGGEVVSFAYPYGAPSDYTPETVALVRAAGFSGACATIPGAVRRGADRFELPRFHVEDCDGDGLARRLAEWTAAGT
jgi:peptidoglycan/xylan/chitin deacetylase (PgdA/CDA1 family)